MLLTDDLEIQTPVQYLNAFSTTQGIDRDQLYLNVELSGRHKKAAVQSHFYTEDWWRNIG